MRFRRTVLRHLFFERQLAFVAFHGRQPLVHRHDRFALVGGGADQRRLAEPDHVVEGEVALRVFKARPHRPGAVGVVESARIGAAQVDDGDILEIVGLVHGAREVGALERRFIGAEPFRGRFQVYVRATDLPVQVDELGGTDDPFHEPLQAVQDADVVNRQPREAVPEFLLHRAPQAFRARPEHVDHVVRQRAAHASRVGFRVVDFAALHAFAASGGGVGERFPVHGVEDDRVAVVGMPLHGRDLVVRPHDSRPPVFGMLEVLAGEVVVGDLLTV